MGKRREEEGRLKNRRKGKARWERERGQGVERDVSVLHGHYVRTYEQHDTRQGSAAGLLRVHLHHAHRERDKQTDVAPLDNGEVQLDGLEQREIVGSSKMLKKKRVHLNRQNVIIKRCVEG